MLSLNALVNRNIQKYSLPLRAKIILTGNNAVATYIKNNSDYTKRYNVTDYVIRSVWYDTQYNVWCVTFDPPDAARGPDMYTLDASIGIIFRGYNGKILYIGPC